jgi:hypothetical protein
LIMLFRLEKAILFCFDHGTCPWELPRGSLETLEADGRVSSGCLGSRLAACWRLWSFLQLLQETDNLPASYPGWCSWAASKWGFHVYGGAPRDGLFHEK